MQLLKLNHGNIEAATLYIVLAIFTANIFCEAPYRSTVYVCRFAPVFAIGISSAQKSLIYLFAKWNRQEYLFYIQHMPEYAVYGNEIYLLNGFDMKKSLL